MGAIDTKTELIKLEYVAYDPRNPEADKENFAYAKVDVKINSIKVNVFMQPILRIVDFTTGQLLPSLRGDSIYQ